MNVRIFYSPAIFCILFLNLVVLSQGQTAKTANVPGKVKSTAYIKQKLPKIDVCFKWWTQVDPRQVLVTIDIEALTDEEIVEGIGCLLQLKGNKNKARIYGRTRSNLNSAQGYKPPKNPATIEIAALYYISYLFYNDWEHAGSIALYDEEEEDIDKINSPEYAERAFRSYEGWFAALKDLGLNKARALKLDPLFGSNISWSGGKMMTSNSVMSTLPGDEIIALLSSKSPEAAQKSAREAFLRGPRMLPQLIGLEGNDSCFYGLRALGEWDSPGLVTMIPSCKGTSKITVEVAALFLVSAIFEEDLKFASPPILCELSEELTCKDSGNTVERVKKAWNANKTWKILVDTQGIEFLRERSHDPLKGSGLMFF